MIRFAYALYLKTVVKLGNAESVEFIWVPTYTGVGPILDRRPMLFSRNKFSG
jgi:hypothetical protein